MEIVRVGELYLDVYLNLAQSYEGEFSGITGKKPDTKGLFALDTPLGDCVVGFLLILAGTPAGLAAVVVKPGSRFEVAEFYIVPSFRKQAWGMRFAHNLWQMFPGQWEVKQIQGAEYASKFWCRAIREFTQGDFVEDKYQDPYWGLVTRQQFVGRAW
ncbi:GNAT family N-acetyltransferase [Desulfobulbus alkaliphilus]|uniref:GNAT family N-acetyltransferase n=1 Tax=Desulfobulbus alkaliphilus TaxID=869814 RepID=UPI001965B1F0|nr:hypothetical protein [Desulfobulbus alkaliphilus]MBM9537815.1 hypothetical protein [Desulfobulbus alkaliphilus]